MLIYEYEACLPRADHSRELQSQHLHKPRTLKHGHSQHTHPGCAPSHTPSIANMCQGGQPSGKIQEGFRKGSCPGRTSKEEGFMSRKGSGRVHVQEGPARSRKVQEGFMSASAQHTLIFRRGIYLVTIVRGTVSWHTQFHVRTCALFMFGHIALFMPRHAAQTPLSCQGTDTLFMLETYSPRTPHSVIDCPPPPPSSLPSLAVSHPTHHQALFIYLTAKLQPPSHHNKGRLPYYLSHNLTSDTQPGCNTTCHTTCHIIWL